MAIKRLNYDKLISGAVTNIIPSSQYTQFSGYNALVGGAAFTQYDADVASAGFQRPTPVIPGLYQGLISGQTSTSQAIKIFRETRTLAAFGPQAPRYAPSLVGQAPDTTRTASGGIPPFGSFTTGPNIKRLSLEDLKAAGRLPLFTVSSVSDVGPYGGTTGIRGLGVTQAARLSFTEIQGLRDIEYASMVQDVPRISSPLDSYSTPGALVPNVSLRGTESIPQFQKNYQSYIKSLPGITSLAIKSYVPGTRSGLATALLNPGTTGKSESNYAIQNIGALGTGRTTGSFGLDIDASLATIPYQTQVIAATVLSPTKVIKTPGENIRTASRPTTEAFNELVRLPMPSFYEPATKAAGLSDLSITKLQSEGPIKVNTLSVPTFSPKEIRDLGVRATTDPGAIYYTAIQELAGRFEDDKLVYRYKSPSTGLTKTVKFDLYSPKPTLLPR